MKLRNLFVGAIASAFALAACQEKEQNLGVPDLSISVSEMTFGKQVVSRHLLSTLLVTGKFRLMPTGL